MSVTIEGIKGYEYQYKVTVLIALLIGYDNAELFVESKGIEDAYLSFKIEDNRTNIEVQVKREKNELDIKKMTEWLSHFEARKSDNNLLSILDNNKDTITLFVTNSRCADETVMLKKDLGSFNSHSLFKTKKDLLDWVKALKNVKFKQSKLGNKRKEFCEIQAHTLESSFKRLLNKVIIWEEISDAILDAEVVRLLNNQYSVSHSNCDITYLNLLENVKQARDEKIDVIPLFKKTILKNKIGTPIIDANYITRTEESDLLSTLNKKKVLLLSGVSQCGKSELAKKIAFEFCSKGYDYKHTNEISEVRNFLAINPKDTKIVVLEDPWGHTKTDDESIEILYKLKNIIQNIQKHHKLIVTSRSEILFDVYSCSSLLDCKIYSHKWKDLAVSNISYLDEYWKAIALINKIPSDIVNLVSYNILKSKKEEILQLGQLNYLANQDCSNLCDKTYDELENIARYNSYDIAKEIKDKGNDIADFMAILALCATTIVSVHIREIAYIYSTDIEEKSIVDKTIFTFSEERGDSFPEYSKEYQLNKKQIEILEYLEERQFIIIKEDKVLFLHPNYYEAGRKLFVLGGMSKQRRFLKYLERSLLCLNPSTVFSSTKQFSFIYNKINKELKHEIIKIAFSSMDSIFPKVEDSSLTFLQKHIDNLQEEDYNLLIDKSQRGGTDSYSIYWKDKNIPYISNEGGISNNYYFKEVVSVLNNTEKTLNDENMVSPYAAWVFLHDFDNNKTLNRKIVNTLMQYDEVFIRSKVAFMVLNNKDIVNKDIINMIFNDSSPSVVFFAIRAILINWVSYNDIDKEFLLHFIKNSLIEIPIAIRAYNLFATFACDYSSEGIFSLRELEADQKKELWNVWANLFPILLDKLPLNLYANPGRIGVTMDTACRYLDKNTGVVVLEAWYKRIEFQLTEGKELDFNEIAIADNLMSITKKDYKIRENLFFKIISSDNINFLLPNLMWIIGYWDYLSAKERNEIISKLYTDIKYKSCIKAMFLTSSIPPAEILDEIFGEADFFDQKPVYILSKMSDELLKDCLNTFYGIDDTGISGLSYHNVDLWNNIIREILFDENHFLFYICLNKLLNDGVNGFSRELHDGNKIWNNICLNSNNLNLLTDELIYLTAKCNCSLASTHDLWTVLINCYVFNNREEEVIMKIADNIELLQQTGSREDILDIFGQEFILKKVLPKLLNDAVIISSLEIINCMETLSDGDKIDIFQKFYTLFNVNCIQFFGTFNLIRDLPKNKRIPTEIYNILSDLPDDIDSVGKEELSKLELKRENIKEQLNSKY